MSKIRKLVLLSCFFSPLTVRWNGTSAGLRQLVGGDHPRPQHGVAVDRLPEAPVLRAARGHVEAERIAGDVVPGLLLRDVAALLADDDDKLGLVVVAAVGEAHRDALRRADQRGVGLEENAGLLDVRREPRQPRNGLAEFLPSPRRAWRSWSAPPGSSAAWPPATEASPRRSACPARLFAICSSLSRHFGSAATTGSTFAV